MQVVDNKMERVEFSSDGLSVISEVRPKMPSSTPGVVKFAYFDFTLVNARKWSAKCRHCNVTMTETRGTTTGFLKHLGRKHPVVYNDYKLSKGSTESGSQVNRKDLKDLSSDPKSPLIFQCIGCGTIIGDSTAWLYTHERLRTITLADTTSNIVRSEVVNLSQEGDDAGCTYIDLSCAKCKDNIGRLYKATTNLQMDILRNNFCIYLDRITIYRVGGTGQGSTLSAEDLLKESAQINFLKAQNKRRMDVQRRSFFQDSVSVGNDDISFDGHMMQECSTPCTLLENYNIAEQFDENGAVIKCESPTSEEDVFEEPFAEDSFEEGPEAPDARGDTTGRKRATHVSKNCVTEPQMKRIKEENCTE